MKAYLDGRIVPIREARVSVLDRGFLMGDSLYEGLRAEQGTIIRMDLHVQRLERGLREAMFHGFDASSLADVSRRAMEANDVRDGFVYVQVTRGVPLPGAPVRARSAEMLAPPTVFAYAEPMTPVRDQASPEVRSAITAIDRRWGLGHLKSNSLMGGVIPAMEALRAGCDDVVMVRDGLVTEGSATNIFLSVGGRGVTPSLESVPILDGVTRAMLLEADPGIEVRPVTEAELREADEIVLAGTRTLVAQVGTLDGRPAGRVPGPFSSHLLDLLRQSVRRCVHCADE